MLVLSQQETDLHAPTAKEKQSPGGFVGLVSCFVYSAFLLLARGVSAFLPWKKPALSPTSHTLR